RAAEDRALDDHSVGGADVERVGDDVDVEPGRSAADDVAAGVGRGDQDQVRLVLLGQCRERVRRRTTDQQLAVGGVGAGEDGGGAVFAERGGGVLRLGAQRDHLDGAAQAARLGEQLEDGGNGTA